MKIFTFGGGGRLDFCREYLSLSPSLETVVILPIPTTKDNIHIKGSDIPLSELYKLCGKGAAVACYGLPEDVRAEMESRGAAVFDGLLDEDFLSANAALTAEGALGVILTGTDTSLSEQRVGIIGYGRIGSRLLRGLMFHGARVKLFTRSAELRRTLGEDGIETAEFNAAADYSGLDILVNTAPTEIMGEEELSRYAEEGLRIYDLASGKCFPDSPSVKKLASIPEAMYPRSAGRLYASFIEKKLREGRE